MSCLKASAARRRWRSCAGTGPTCARPRSACTPSRSRTSWPPNATSGARASPGAAWCRAPGSSAWPRSARQLVTSRVAFAAPEDTKDTLIVIFLRGGMDGLSVVAPGDDPNYRQMRPNIAIPMAALLPAGRGFGLNPAMTPLYPFWQAGKMAAVHAVASPDASRSHFQAQDALERGRGVGGGAHRLARPGPRRRWAPAPRSGPSRRARRCRAPSSAASRRSCSTASATSASTTTRCAARRWRR